jgi:mannosyltransferase
MSATPSRVPQFRWPFGIGGGVLILAAISISNSRIEQAFSRPVHSLAWGPALFRGLLALHGLALILAGWFGGSRSAPVKRSPACRGTWAILAGLTLLAALLSVPSLNSGLWTDEVLTLVHYARSPVAQILTSFPDQNQHMLYSLLAHCSMRIFGEQPWALRLPAVIFGAGSIWALFLLGRRLFGETEALLACALMTVSYHRIWFSQNARGYTGMLFFSLLATWLWLEAMERDKWRTWLAYSVCVALGLWIHMTMLFVAAAHALIFLIVWLRSDRRPEPLARAALAFALCLTLSLQIYALPLPQFFRAIAPPPPPPNYRTAVGGAWFNNPIWLVLQGLRGLHASFALTAAVALGALFCATGWFRLYRQQQAAAWAMILPAIVSGGAMLAWGHNVWPRFFFFCMGFVILIAIHGAMQASRWFPKAGYAIAGLMIVASAVTVPRCYALPKQDFIGARDYVERQRTADDQVIVIGVAQYAYSEYYAPAWPVAKDSAELTALLRPGGRAFLLYTLPVELRAFHRDLLEIVDAGFDTVKVFPGTLAGGEIYVCRERSRHSLKQP